MSLFEFFIAFFECELNRELSLPSRLYPPFQRREIFTPSSSSFSSPHSSSNSANFVHPRSSIGKTLSIQCLPLWLTFTWPHSENLHVPRSPQPEPPPTRLSRRTQPQKRAQHPAAGHPSKKISPLHRPKTKNRTGRRNNPPLTSQPASMPSKPTQLRRKMPSTASATTYNNLAAHSIVWTRNSTQSQMPYAPRFQVYLPMVPRP